jgi:hypothetical protein
MRCVWWGAWDGREHMPSHSDAGKKSTRSESKHRHAGCSLLAISLLGMSLLAAALLVHFLLLTSVARNGQCSFFSFVWRRFVIRTGSAPSLGKQIALCARVRDRSLAGPKPSFGISSANKTDRRVNWETASAQSPRTRQFAFVPIFILKVIQSRSAIFTACKSSSPKIPHFVFHPVAIVLIPLHIY